MKKAWMLALAVLLKAADGAMWAQEGTLEPSERVAWKGADLKDVLNDWAAGENVFVVFDENVMRSRILGGPDSLPRKDVLTRLLVFLHHEGHALIETGSPDRRAYRCVPVANAIKAAVAVYERVEDLPVEDWFVSYVHHLHYADAREAQVILQPLVTDGRSLMPIQDRLVISDYTTNIRRIVRFLEAIDVPGTKNPLSRAAQERTGQVALRITCYSAEAATTVDLRGDSKSDSLWGRLEAEAAKGGVIRLASFSLSTDSGESATAESILTWKNTLITSTKGEETTSSTTTMEHLRQNVSAKPRLIDDTHVLIQITVSCELPLAAAGAGASPSAEQARRSLALSGSLRAASGETVVWSGDFQGEGGKPGARLWVCVRPEVTSSK